jgi:hypothetical protein
MICSFLSSLKKWKSDRVRLINAKNRKVIADPFVFVIIKKGKSDRVRLINAKNGKSDRVIPLEK